VESALSKIFRRHQQFMVLYVTFFFLKLREILHQILFISQIN